MADASPYLVVAGLVSFQVLANNAPLDSTCRVLSVSVTKGINKIGSARFELIDGDPATGQFPVSDAQTFVPGTPITILAGYDNVNTVIFKGIVIKLSVASQGAQGVGVTVECRDLAIKTNGAHNSCLFENQTTSAALTTIIGTYDGLSADIATTAVTYEELTQYKTTDWDFIVTQAEANGQIVVNDLGKITTVVPSTDSTPVLTLEYGTNVYSFALDMDARTQYQSVKGKAWSPKQQAMIEVTGNFPTVETLGNVEAATLAAASGQTEYVFETTAATDQASLQALVDAYLMKLALAKVKGSIELPGSAAVLPGSLVTLNRVGNRFSGTAFVSEVTHTIGADWKTQLGIGLDEQWFAQRNPDVASPVKAGNLPGVSGLYVATVQQVQADPANEFRVEVKVPTLANTVWARLAQPYATTTAGSFFYPEVNDEVILAYFSDDPRYPVVLGALYSSARAPAYTPDEKNTKKAITTAAGLVLEFDDGQKILTIKTPGDVDGKKPNQLVISDAGKSITLTDQQQNTITMSASGLTLDSKSSVKITAANDITLESTGGSVTIKAAQALSASGATSSVKGDNSLSLTGSGTGELSVNAALIIKGMEVAIN